MCLHRFINLYCTCRRQQTPWSRVAIIDPHGNRLARAGGVSGALTRGLRRSRKGVARSRSRRHGFCIFRVDLRLEASILVFKNFYVSQGMYLEIDASEYKNVRVLAALRTNTLCEHGTDCRAPQPALVCYSVFFPTLIRPRQIPLRDFLSISFR